ncbi:MAG: hypothetical protein B6U86_05170 [Candidatus Altiarchaeales archaeon ex4484_43]|nr:MAG: hypothetical protein B6U86_05170 [Candidatus Altiarchaeales archaeon ex4484_43]RLI89872.1 MAG: hypothetical protein DRO62_00630 [Candidatus Altiarchaeales archaeon]
MEYETIATEYLDYGRNKFLEMSKKKPLPDGDIFLNISKGYYTPDGERRYQKGIGFPNDPEFVKKLIEKLQKISKG